MTTYIVRRHGGRVYDDWRQLYVGEDELRATALFDEASSNLRQGTLELIRDGQIMRGVSGPRLRTRW
jgi:hypothetical protein